MRRGDLGKSTFVGGIAFKWTVEYVQLWAWAYRVKLGRISVILARSDAFSVVCALKKQSLLIHLDQLLKPQMPPREIVLKSALDVWVAYTKLASWTKEGRKRS